MKTETETRPLKKEFIAQFLPENPTVIEAGAHIGRDTVKMAKLWPNSKIYAFEPVKDLYKTLINKTKNYNNIWCYNLALSNKAEKISMYVSSGRSTALSSIFKPTGGLNKHPETVFAKEKIEATTLNNWAKKNGITQVDFIWLDAQGSELKILESAENILKTVKLVLVEASLSKRYEGAPLITELQTYIENQNFKLIAQDTPQYEKINLLYKSQIV